MERSFSVQKSIHTLVRNRLAHDKVAMLIFVHTNLSFLSGREVLGDHPGFLESVLDDIDGEEGARSDEDWSGERGGRMPVDRPKAIKIAFILQGQALCK